jgi:hypothetical protein
MEERITKGDVETAAQRLNVAAEALGLQRRFRVYFGSAGNGIPHRLEETHPELSHPISTPIGGSYRDAERYLRAMLHALESAKHDRDYRREATLGAPVNSLLPILPTAEGVRNVSAAEAVAMIRPHPFG